MGARSVSRLMAASVLCNLVKRYINDEPLPDKVILNLAAFTVIAWTGNTLAE